MTTWEAERRARLSRSRVTETAGVGAFDCCESWGDGNQGVRLCVGAHLRAPSSGELEIGGRQPPERRDGGRAHDRELPGEVLDGMGTEPGRRGGTPQTRRMGRPQRCMDALRGTKRALFRPFPPPRRQGGFSSRAITANNPVSRPPRTQHVGEGELLWTAKASGAFNEPFEYRYAVVDGEMNVLRWDAFAHEAHFAPRDVSETNASPTDEERKRRDRVEIRDTWERAIDLSLTCEHD